MLITILFKADVNAQAGAYATGAGLGFSVLTVVSVYALAAKVLQKRGWHDHLGGVPSFIAPSNAAFWPRRAHQRGSTRLDR